MAIFTKLEPTLCWYALQVIAFFCCLVVILLEVYLTRKKNNPTTRSYNFAEYDKNRRRASTIVFASLAIFSLFLVGRFYLNHLKESHMEWLEQGRSDLMDDKEFSVRFCFLPPFAMAHLHSWSTSIAPMSEFSTVRAKSHDHLWWTQQYLAGLLNFAFFLQIQSRVRTLRPHTAFAFTWVALTSLSFAECATVVYITLTPLTKNKKRFSANWLLGSIVPMLAVTVSIYRLPDAAGTETFTPMLFVCLGVPLMMSFAQAILPEESVWRLGFVSVHQSQTRVWLPSAAASFGLHTASTTRILWTSIPEDYNAGTSYIERADLNIKNMIQGLHEDPTVGAIGWDVVLGFVSLAVWTFVSSASTRGMLRCTIFPTIKTYQISFLDGKRERGTPLSETTIGRAAKISPLGGGDLVEGEEVDYFRYNERQRKTPFAEFLDKRNHDSTGTAQSVSLSMVLGLLGGLGVQSAGVFGAGAQHLDA